MSKTGLSRISSLILTVLAFYLPSCAMQGPGSSNAQTQIPPVNPSNQNTPPAPVAAPPPPIPTIPNNGTAPTQRPPGRTPQELGAEYPKLLRQAREKLATMPASTPIKFPLGVNSPIRIGEAEAGDNTQGKQYEVVGYINSARQAKPLLVPDVLALLDQFSANTSSMTPTPGEILVADASGTVAQSGGVPVINLVVKEKQNNTIYVVPNIRLIAFFRDALNASLNSEIATSDVDLSRLDLSLIQPRR